MKNKEVYVVIAFEKNAKGESYADRIIGVYTTAEKANKAYYKAGTFCTITIKELDK